jgi:hypothetical protein
MAEGECMDATLVPESRPFEVIDRQPSASRIRTSVHDAVESALAEVIGSTDTRSALRAAAQTLGDALAAHAQASSPQATRAARGSMGDTACTDARDARAGRASAFRRMAGVH